MMDTRVRPTKYRRILASVLAAAGFLAFGLFFVVQTARAQTGDIEGTVAYYGSAFGNVTVQLAVFTTTTQPLPAPVATAGTTTDVGAYLIAAVEDGSYFIFAYLDINSNSQPDAGVEPFAWYDYEGDGRPDAINVLGGTTSNIDILLTDLWRPLGGPLGQVNSIVAQPGVADTLYAAVGHPYSGKATTLYTSTDGADTWVAIYTDTTQSISSLAVTGTLVYAAGETADGRSTVLKSQNAGAAWTQVLTADLGAFRNIAIDPHTTSIAYVAGVEQGASTSGIRSGVVYSTQSGGANWTRVFTIPEGDLYAIAVNPVTPTIVYAGGYATQSGTHVAVIYRSENSGANWSAVLTDTDGVEQQFTSIVVHPMTPTIVYAGSQLNKAVYRATDGGLTPLSWTKVITDRGFRLTLDPPNTVYAADDWRELAKSLDGGDIWTRSVGGQLAPDVIQALALDGASASHAVYLGTRSAGVFRSDDGGITWNAKNTGIVPTTAPRDIAIDPQNRERLFVATGCDGGWRTIDGGQTWERQLGDCVQAFAVHPQDSFIVYAGITQNATKAIERSGDGGDTFSSIYTGTADIDVLAIAAADPNVVMAGGDNGGAALLLRSIDSGLTWNPVFTLAQGAVAAVAIHPADAATAFIGVANGSVVPAFGAIYRTTDGGTTWTPVYLTGAGAIHSVVIDPKVPTTIYATDDQRVLKSVDGGTTWGPIHTYAEINRNLLAVDPRLADHLYLAGPGYIAETIDGGITWSDWMAPINQGTEGQTATALAVDRGGITQTLYAGFSGVWFYTRPSPQTSDFTTERVRGGLLQPTAIDWVPSGQMFIAHQDGRVLVDTDGVLTTFIDLSPEVNNNWNRGLIGIEVHPSFPISPYIYLLYTYDPPELPGFDGAVDGKDGNGARVSRLVRVTADATKNYAVAVDGSKLVILGSNSTIDTLGDPADAGGEAGTAPACTNPNGTAIVDCMASEGPSHSVGWLEFGHDGYLWVTNGEGAPYINPDSRAARSQDLDSLGGKILRIDPATGQGVPGNPYYNAADPGSNRSRVWARGLRNPFRFALHPISNTIYVGDVGWYAWEELNQGVAARNFGWPCYEGGASGNVRHSLYEGFAGTAAVCQPLYDSEPNNGVQAPLYAYQNIAGAAIVAGDFYTGTRYPSAYLDALFIADYDKRTIRYLTFDGSGTATVHPFLEDISSVGGPVQLTLGPDGYLYYVALNPDPAGESEIRRVLYTSAPSVQIDATPRYGYVPLTVQFTRTLSSATDQLTHKWTFGDGGSSTEIAPAHTYAVNGAYTAFLTVTTPQGKSSSDRIFISVGNMPPVVTITTPLSGSHYTISTTLAFSGEAHDPESGPVPAADLHWKALWFFNGHLHPAFTTLDGVKSGQFIVPAHNDNTTMHLCLTASDNMPELQDPTACVELVPQTAPYTFVSDPAGYQLAYDGIVYTTPFTINMVVNAPRTIAAPLLQQGLPFVSWSDGGAAIHTILGQPTPQTLTALYRLRAWLPLILRGTTP